MKKLLTSIFITLAMLVMTVGTVFAQEATPTAAPTSISGTVQSVEVQTDPTTNQTIIVVTLTDDLGATQTVNLSVDTAVALGLVTTDPTTGTTTVSDTAVGSTVQIDPTTVIGGGGTGGGEEEKQHPVGSALADFFGELLGVDYDTIMQEHEDGVGFGVIVQALWLTKETGGSTDTFTTLLDAKKSGDFSEITLADGSTPKNWGDVVKSLKKGDNLGSIKSGHAQNDQMDVGNTGDNSETDGTDTAQNNSQSNGHGHGNGNDHSNGDHGNQNNNGHGNGKP